MISIIIPTYNERGNIIRLITSIASIIRRSAIQGEIIVVDDNSPDGTASAVKKLSKYAPLPVRLIKRPEKMGLSSAVIDGIAAAKYDVVGVMDADFSHPPEFIPRLAIPVLKGECDFAIGSRYINGGRIVRWPFSRRAISIGATFLSRPLTGVKDSVSGYFFFRKDILRNVVLEGIGYKICLEILVKGKYREVREIPITFVNRKEGKSKLDLKECANYVFHLIKLYSHRLRKSV